MTTETPRARLERAFETLKEQKITPVLILRGSTGVIEDNLADYKAVTWSVCEPPSWVGAHAGNQETGGAHWVDGGLYYTATGRPVEQLWFSYPLDRPDIARALLDALEANAFYASWFHYDADGEIVGPGTDADCVRLVLKEEN